LIETFSLVTQKTSDPVMCPWGKAPQGQTAVAWP